MRPRILTSTAVSKSAFTTTHVQHMHMHTHACTLGVTGLGGCWVLWPVMAVAGCSLDCQPKRGPSGCNCWLVLAVEGHIAQVASLRWRQLEAHREWHLLLMGEQQCTPSALYTDSFVHQTRLCHLSMKSLNLMPPLAASWPANHHFGAVIHTHICAHTHTRTRTHTHIHTHAHTHTHTHTPVQFAKS